MAATGRRKDPLEALVSEIERGRGPAIALLTGGEEYLVHQARRRLLGALLHSPRSGGVTVVDEPRSAAPILEALATRNLFTPRRVVLVRELPLLGRSTAASRLLAERLDRDHSPRSATLLIVHRGKLDKRSTLYKVIKKRGVHLDFPSFSPFTAGDPRRDGMFPVVKGWFEEAGLRLDHRAFRRLRARCPNDLWSLRGEVDKLVCHVQGRSTVTVEDVDAVVSEGREEALFTLHDRLSAGDVRAALEVLEDLLSRGGEGAVVSSMGRFLRRQSAALVLVELARERRLALGPDALRDDILPLAKEVRPELLTPELLGGMHPFRLWKIMEGAMRVDPARLVAARLALARFDRARKSGAARGDVTLQQVLLALAGPARLRRGR